MHISLRVLSIAVLFSLGGSASALTLDWSTASWTAGSLSNSYNIDPAKPGNDVTVTVSGDTAQLQPEIVSPYPQTPAITTDFQGGLATAPKTLDLAMNLQNLTQAVTITVTFSSAYTQGVNNVSFSLFDIDFSNVSGSQYQDELRSITATTVNNTTVAAVVAGSPNNVVTGSSTLLAKVDGTVSTPDTGAGSGNANVTISFGNNAIKSFTFTYGSGTGVPGLTDPTYQHMGIYNINFSPVPEVNPTLASALSCSCALLLALLHRAKARKR